MDTPQSIIEFPWGSSRMTYLLSPSTVETGKSLSLPSTTRVSRHIADVMGSVHIPPEKEGRTLPRQPTMVFLKLLSEGGRHPKHPILIPICMFTYFLTCFFLSQSSSCRNYRKLIHKGVSYPSAFPFERHGLRLSLMAKETRYPQRALNLSTRGKGISLK